MYLHTICSLATSLSSLRSNLDMDRTKACSHVLLAIPSSNPLWSQYAYFYCRWSSVHPANIILELFSLPIVETIHWKVVPYQFGYGVYDEVGDDCQQLNTICLVVFASYLYGQLFIMFFLADTLSAFQSTNSKKNKKKFCDGQRADPPKIVCYLSFTRVFCCLPRWFNI